MVIRPAERRGRREGERAKVLMALRCLRLHAAPLRPFARDLGSRAQAEVRILYELGANEESRLCNYYRGFDLEGLFQGDLAMYREECEKLKELISKQEIDRANWDDKAKAAFYRKY